MAYFSGDDVATPDAGLDQADVSDESGGDVFDWLGGTGSSGPSAATPLSFVRALNQVAANEAAYNAFASGLNSPSTTSPNFNWSFGDDPDPAAGYGASSKAGVAIRPSVNQVPTSDPSIPEVMNPDGSMTLPKGAVGFAISPISGLPDQEIVAGRANPASYATATFDNDNKVINIQLGVNYQRPSIFNLSAGDVSDAQYNKYVDLANSGIAKYWSRTVNLNGEDWTVNVNASNDPDSAMAIKVANPGPLWMGDFGDRSFNGYPYKVGTLYYDPGYGADSDGMFARTAAHEIGHSFLTDASSSSDWSWGHEGTSTDTGNTYSDVPVYPASGEINLMRYYNKPLPFGYADYLNRSIASENDVKTLLYIAGRGK